MLNTLTTFGFRPLTAAVFLAALVSVVWPVESPAQQAAPQTVPAADKQPVPQDVEALRRTVEEQGKRIAELESNDLQSSERIEQLEQSQAETQELMMTGESIEDNDIDDEQQRLKISGFFDLTLNRFFWDKDSAWNLYITEQATFAISHLNLYVQAQLTDTLSSLIELKFSFSPSGTDTAWETGLRNEDGSVTDVPGPTYQRADATYRDPFTTENNHYGSVMIERVQLTWSPRDWMQFTVGRYLTPYGVWNVDHGSTVVLPVKPPYMQLRDMIMKAQTGIMAFGRLFPHPKLYLDYALTISNGSGRTEANLDFDDEKAFGLKLALAYMGRNFTAEMGGYAAYTTWADVKKQVVIDQYNEKIDVVVRPYDVSDELMVSAHAKLRFFGVLLQSELVLHNTYYE
ncbi:MAG: hypothetical protein MUC50_23605, partial [Myxococcota bacterium]|nr:hypothetical protein [Myxococcota bacterium]